MSKIILIHGDGDTTHQSLSKHLFKMIGLGHTILVRPEQWFELFTYKLTDETMPKSELLMDSDYLILWQTRLTHLVKKLSGIRTIVQNPIFDLEEVEAQDNFLVTIDNTVLYELYVLTYPKLLSRIINNEQDRDLSLIRLLLGHESE